MGILMEVKRKRRRKSIQPRRKINTFIKELNCLLFHCILSTVKYWIIVESGAVSQQRKTCPNCGPGTFMAQHWDRYYCGLCHTTIKMDAETVKKNYEKMRAKKEALETERKAKEK